MGCSTTPQKAHSYSAKQLYEFACSPGRKVQSVQGDVRLQIKSSEISGQFSAHAEVLSPDQLKLEVTNFVGGTEARILVRSDQYEITRFRGDESSQKSKASTWGGIPLKWAAGLFLGRIPCPELDSDAELRFDAEGSLTVSVVPKGNGPDQKFIYSFKERNDSLWPAALHWEQEGPSPATLDFTFDEPEQGTLSPLKWEARSQQGGVKVRWRERQAALFPAD